MVNVMKTSRPRLLTFLTWPSNTSDIAILRRNETRSMRRIIAGLSAFLFRNSPLAENWTLEI
jgi:hypothetical protein